MILHTITNEVETILVRNPETRASDDKLYGVYLMDKVGLISAIDFFLHIERYPDVASYGTVSRARRKIQETHPELMPPKEVQEAREEMQGCFFDWARGL